MGYAGQPMKVIKANRALLKKKRTFRDIKKSYIGYAAKTQLEFKQLTPFEQKKIRAKIIAQIRKDKIQDIKVSILSLVILAVFFWLIYLFLTS